ncbi:MAG: hypothetical protein R3F43_15235 [bacterium]
MRVAAATAYGVEADGSHLSEIAAWLATEGGRGCAAPGGGGGDARRAPSGSCAATWTSPRHGTAWRPAAVDALGNLGRPEVAEDLLERAGPRHPRVVRMAALAGLGRLARLEEADKAVRRQARRRSGDPLGSALPRAVRRGGGPQGPRRQGQPAGAHPGPRGRAFRSGATCPPGALGVTDQ